jgi:hypothetical protein
MEIRKIYVYYTRMYMISIMQVESEINTLTMIFQSLIIFNRLFLICVYASKTPPLLIVIMFVDDGLTYNDNSTQQKMIQMITWRQSLMLPSLM